MKKRMEPNLRLTIARVGWDGELETGVDAEGTVVIYPDGSQGSREAVEALRRRLAAQLRACIDGAKKHNDKLDFTVPNTPEKDHVAALVALLDLALNIASALEALAPWDYDDEEDYEAEPEPDPEPAEMVGR